MTSPSGSHGFFIFLQLHFLLKKLHNRKIVIIFAANWVMALCGISSYSYSLITSFSTMKHLHLNNKKFGGAAPPGE